MTLKAEKSATGSTLLDLALVAVSGAAMWAAFPALSWWFLVVPSLALLIGLVDRVSPWRGGAYAALWAMVFFMPHISWIMIATNKTWGAWIALAGAEAFFIYLWGLSFGALGTWKWSRTLWGQALGGGLLWVAFEQLRSRVPFGGFPWGNVSYPQVDSPMIAYAPLGGEALVSFLVFVAAVCLRRALGPAVIGNPTWARIGALALSVVLVFGPFVVRLPNAEEAGNLRVGVVQGNVEIPMEETFSIPRKVTGNHVEQTLMLAGQTGGDQTSADQPGGDQTGVDVVFWGENATDIDPRQDPKTAELVQQAVDATGVPLVFGLMEYKGGGRYNWIGIWYPDSGLDLEMYGKQHPVPWGEYIPMRKLTLWLATEAARISLDMFPVENPGFLTVVLNDGEALPIAVGICFEVAYEPIIREGVELGGQLIYIPTNNAHFQNSPESVQQLQMGQFRAAEFSRTALQVSTNGVSAIVRPDGTIYEATETQVAGFLEATVPLRTVITPAVKLGEFPAILAMVSGGILALTSLGAYIYGRSLTRAAAKKS